MRYLSISAVVVFLSCGVVFSADKYKFNPFTNRLDIAIDDTLSSTGTINLSTNPINWTQLKNVPAGFADGTDDGAGGAADGGIVSPGTFPWVNYNGLNVSTMSAFLIFSTTTDGAITLKAGANNDGSITNIGTVTVGGSVFSAGFGQHGYLKISGMVSGFPSTTTLSGSKGTINTYGGGLILKSGISTDAGGPVEPDGNILIVAGSESSPDLSNGYIILGSSIIANRLTASQFVKTNSTNMLISTAGVLLSELEKDPSQAGTVNTSTNPLDWTQLKSVPAGFADGTDEGGVGVVSPGTFTWNAAAGIIGTTATFSADTLINGGTFFVGANDGGSDVIVGGGAGDVFPAIYINGDGNANRGVYFQDQGANRGEVRVGTDESMIIRTLSSQKMYMGANSGTQVVLGTTGKFSLNAEPGTYGNHNFTISDTGVADVLAAQNTAPAGAGALLSVLNSGGGSGGAGLALGFGTQASSTRHSWVIGASNANNLYISSGTTHTARQLVDIGTNRIDLNTSSVTVTGAGGLRVAYGIDAGSGTFAASLTVAGQSVCQEDGTDCPPAAGGSAAIAVATGTVDGYTGFLSSPTASIVFSSDTHIGQLTGNATAFITLNPSSVTLLGPSIDLSGAEATGDLPANRIAAGTIDSDVMASSVTQGAFYSHPTIRSNLGLAIGSDVQAWDATLDDLAAVPLGEDNSVAADAIAAGTLPTDVIASSLAFNSAVGTTIADDVIDFVDMADSMTLDANTQVSFGSNGLTFSVANPSSPAFDINGTGAFSSDLAHFHQHTGNPTGGNILHLEAEDPDVNPILHVQSDGPASGTSDVVNVLIDTDDDDDVNFVPLEIRDDNAANNDLLAKINYAGGLTLASSVTATAGKYSGQVEVNGGIISSQTTVGNSDITLYNQSNTGSAHARVLIQTGGTSGGDPTTLLSIPGGEAWSVGIDNSEANDPLQISPASSLTNSNHVLKLTTAGQLTLKGYNCSGNASGGALTADANGVVSCTDDDSGGATTSTRSFVFDASSLQALETSFAPIESTSTLSVIYLTRAFDDTAREYVNGFFKIPENLRTTGTITIRLDGRAKTAGAANTAWTLEHLPLADSENIGGSYLTSNSGDLASDTTQADLNQDTWTMSVTSSTWAANDTILFRLSRDPGAGSDLTGDYYLKGMTIDVPTQ